MQQADLSMMRTQLANQRTYLAYMRTGFVVATVAGIFKKWYLGAFGLFMVVVSTAQYYYVQRAMEQKTSPADKFHYVPLVYSVLSVAVLYLQFYEAPKKGEDK